VGMTVVEVRDVGMGVGALVVAVLMGVTPDDTTVVIVIVVGVVVFVFVFVLDHFVSMLMLMCGSERYCDPGSGERDGDELDQLDCLAEHDPRDQRADERCCCEDHLAASCAKIPRTFHPEDDRKAIAGRSNRQGAHYCRGSDCGCTVGERQSKYQVGRPRHGAFQEHDVFGAELINLGRDAVVEAPGDAGPGNEQRPDADISTRLPNQDHASPRHECCSDDDTMTKVFSKQRRREQNRGCEFQIQ
jgi:hypothetical protein